MRREKLIFPAVCVLIALFLPQCKGETYLGLSREALESKLASADYAFIDKVDGNAPPGALRFTISIPKQAPRSFQRFFCSN